MKVAFIRLLVFFFFVAMLGEVYIRSSSFFALPGRSTVSIVAEGASGGARASSGYKRLNRKQLKEQEEVVLEDYGRIDPTPATKTSVGPKPIDHGSPLIPYIPQKPLPTPPPPSYEALSPRTG